MSVSKSFLCFCVDDDVLEKTVGMDRYGMVWTGLKEKTER